MRRDCNRFNSIFLKDMGFPYSSFGKESVCNADSWVRKIPWRRNRLPTPVFLDFPGGSAGKGSACNAGALGLIPELGRSPGDGKGYPLQYSGLENSMDNPWGRKVSDMTKQQSKSLRLQIFSSSTDSNVSFERK